MEVTSCFDGHRTKNKNKKVSTVLCQYFWMENHSLSEIAVLLHVEDFYMNKLVTVMPFVINDHITNLNINLSIYDYRIFNLSNTPVFPYPHSRKEVMDTVRILNLKLLVIN